LKIPNPKFQSEDCYLWSLGSGIWNFVRWVANGTRTRNNQNHNLGLYH
jgi:hypothetical protein